jgi:tRNA threonylcarbamoyladenosine biosynthesis protein TsaE
LSVFAMPETTFACNAADEAAMSDIGAMIAKAVLASGGAVIYLQGTLGMGKTTLSRAIIQALGWADKVKSPTYTLVESYDLEPLTVAHFDLYRLADPEELEFMGIRDYDQPNTLCLVEWPDRGLGILPKADLTIELTEHQSGRQLGFTAHSPTGEQLCAEIQPQATAG